MAKSFVCRRTPHGQAVTAGTIDHVRQRLERAEHRHGRDDLKALGDRILLAAMYCVVEDYEKAEPLLTDYLAAAKGKRTPNPEELLWASSLLSEAYFAMNRILESLAVINEAKRTSRPRDPSVKDPILGALWQLALSFGANSDSAGRQQGFAAALMALSWCMTHGLYRTLVDAPVLDQIRLFFTSYGIGEEEWKWTVKHAHRTRYDFVGLLSILLYHTGLVPPPVESMIRRKPRVHVVR